MQMWLDVFSKMISFWNEESGTALCPFFQVVKCNVRTPPVT